MGIIATPLGWIMKGCYFVCKNYGIALLLFTILTRLIVFPLNVKQQKSTARMTMLQPELEKIKKKYAKNQQKQSLFRILERFLNKELLIFCVIAFCDHAPDVLIGDRTI